MSDPDLAAGHERHVVLLVGGFDPSGGAGLLQDASVVRALGLHPVAVVTSIAVQNTMRLARRADLPAQLLKDQLATLVEEFLLGAVKTGMLPTAEIVDALAEWLAALPRLPLVLDPVLRSTSGGILVDPEAQTAMVRALFPRARVLTPNLDEARALTGRPVSERDDLPKAAEALLELGPEWVLVKGGHLGKGEASDYLASKQGGLWFEEEARPDGEARGTGCALASAIAVGLARGEPVPEAVRRAKKAVTAAMDAGYRAGRGRFLAPHAD
jgi:hydroxymethylpyrimidine/phosphomethylpyrimidine kinase